MRLPRPVSTLLRRLNNPQDTAAATTTAILLLCGEAILCSCIIQRVAYTEIDWLAYMQQIKGFLQGERNYTNLKGSTGPLVYPAGFLYIYSALYWLTGGGDILSAQLVFVGIYLANQAIVFWLYITSKVVPPWALVLLCLSKRIHSIFLLRMFNDGVAMLLAYAATALLVQQHWRWSLVVYSAATSVKMNVLLMAPAVLVILLKGASVDDVIKGTLAGVILQLVLGAPFLVSYPGSYLSKAFELSRVFLHIWSVNFKFLPENIFQSRTLATILLAAHVALLLLFAQFRWCRHEGGLGVVGRAWWHRRKVRVIGTGPFALRPEHILTVVFTGNFIGIICARTLHYQFYAWYFHTLPLLLWCTRIHVIVRLGLWLAIEVIWNIFPSTLVSSLYLAACHVGLLIGLWSQPRPCKPIKKGGGPWPQSGH